MDRLTLSSGYDNRSSVLEVDLDCTNMAAIYDWCMNSFPDHGEEQFRLPPNAPVELLTLVRRGLAMDLLFTGNMEGDEPPFQYAGCIGPSHFRRSPETFEQASLLDGLEFPVAVDWYSPEKPVEDDTGVPLTGAPQMTLREYLNVVTLQPLLPFQASPLRVG